MSNRSDNNTSTSQLTFEGETSPSCDNVTLLTTNTSSRLSSTDISYYNCSSQALPPPPINRGATPEWELPIEYFLGQTPLMTTHFTESPGTLTSELEGSDLFGPVTPPKESPDPSPSVPVPASKKSITIPVTFPKRPRHRRRYHEIVRNYPCHYVGCEKAYGALQHLNTHIVKAHKGLRLRARDFPNSRN